MTDDTAMPSDSKNIYYKGSSQAADLILPLLFDRLRIESVIDVGCGFGTWLYAARRLGASRTVGVENEWSRRRQYDQRIEIRWQDLEKRLAIRKDSIFVYVLRLPSTSRQRAEGVL